MKKILKDIRIIHNCGYMVPVSPLQRCKIPMLEWRPLHKQWNIGLTLCFWWVGYRWITPLIYVAKGFLAKVWQASGIQYSGHSAIW